MLFPLRRLTRLWRFTRLRRLNHCDVLPDGLHRTPSLPRQFASRATHLRTCPFSLSSHAHGFLHIVVCLCLPSLLFLYSFLLAKGFRLLVGSAAPSHWFNDPSGSPPGCGNCTLYRIFWRSILHPLARYTVPFGAVHSTFGCSQLHYLIIYTSKRMAVRG
ncbi:hypothetical protein K523DRAFT_38469 [Schizophyllum commune Tattone D]|nr:hypothetical protein K523DRAFT_38469 [Schizophyllum commune Tattone D]